MRRSQRLVSCNSAVRGRFGGCFFIGSLRCWNARSAFVYERWRKLVSNDTRIPPTIADLCLIVILLTNNYAQHKTFQAAAHVLSRVHRYYSGTHRPQTRRGIHQRRTATAYQAEPRTTQSRIKPFRQQGNFYELILGISCLFRGLLQCCKPGRWNEHTEAPVGFDDDSVIASSYMIIPYGQQLHPSSLLRLT